MLNNPFKDNWKQKYCVGLLVHMLLNVGANITTLHFVSFCYTRSTLKIRLVRCETQPYEDIIVIFQQAIALLKKYIHTGMLVLQYFIQRQQTTFLLFTFAVIIKANNKYSCCLLLISLES